MHPDVAQRLPCLLKSAIPRRSMSFCLLLTFLTAASTLANLSDGFAFSRALMPTNTSLAGVGVVELDGPACDAWREGTTNLMVLDESSSSNVPVLIRMVTPLDVPTTEDLVPMTVLSWVTQAETTVEIVLEMKDLTQSPNRFRIGPDRTPFHVRCSIESSVDCAEWLPLTVTQGLFRVAGTSLDRSELTFEAQGAFFFRVILSPAASNEHVHLVTASEGAIGDGAMLGLSAEDLQFVEVQRDLPADTAMMGDKPRRLDRIVESNTEQHVYLFTSDGLPIRKLDLEIDPSLVRVAVRVLGRSNSDAEWTEITHQNVYQLGMLDSPFRSTSVVFAQPQRFNFYRMEMAVLDQLTVRAFGPVVVLQFPCEAGHCYRLLHGGEATAVAPAAGLLDGAEVSFTLGPTETNRPRETPPPLVPDVVTTATPPPGQPPEVPPSLSERGRHQLLQVTLGLVVVCWLWFLGRLSKGNRS